VLHSRLSNIYTRTSAGRIIALIFFVALILRCASLDLKIFHHDEAIHAWMAYNLITTGDYLYDPAYHGPLLYYLTGFAFWALGDSDSIARLLPGLFGAAIVPLFWILHREGWLDKNHAIFGALFYSVSPSMVYFSRFLRHDIFQLFFTVSLFILILLYLDKGRWQYAIGASISAACGLCLKEDMPLTLAIFGSFFFFMYVAGFIHPPKKWKRDMLCGILVMSGIGILCYSTFFSNLEMVILAPGKAIGHWLGVHGECRICGAPWYYIFLLMVYELPILLLALACLWWFGVRDGGFYQLKTTISKYLQRVKLGFGLINPYMGIRNRSHFLMLFSIYWVILAGICYALIGEKVPWLLIHQLFPLILIGSYGLTGNRVVLGVIAGIILAMTAGYVCFTPVDINDPIVQAQNSEDLKHVINLIAASHMSVVTTDAYWPLPWYFRGENWNKVVLLAQKPSPVMILEKNPDVVIMLDTNSYDATSLPGYKKEKYLYNYSFSLPLIEHQFPEWFFMRDGERLRSYVDVFTKNSTPTLF
jgi:uncharacterized protein (TIGR03663 family)